MSWIARQTWVLVSALAMSATAAAEELTFTTGDWRPYIFEENGTVDPKMPGFSVEIVNSVFANLGYQITYLTAPFLRQLYEVEQGKFVALVGVYQEEAPNLIFPEEPIGMTQNCFFTSTDQTWRYKSLKDLPAINFATIEGYTYGSIDGYIEANENRVIRLTGSEVNMMSRLTQLVDIHRVTAFVQDIAVAEHFFKIEGLEGRYKKAGCLPFIATMVGFSPKDSRTATFIQDFDVEMDRLRRSGDLEKILAKYGIADWK